MKSFYLLLRTFSYIPLSVLEGKEIYTERSIAWYGTCNIGNPISKTVQRYAPFPPDNCHKNFHLLTSLFDLEYPCVQQFHVPAGYLPKQQRKHKVFL